MESIRERPLRVAIATESFLPTTNGVTTSVCRVLDYLRANGHEAIVITPSAGLGTAGTQTRYAGYRVYELPAVPSPAEGVMTIASWPLARR